MKLSRSAHILLWSSGPLLFIEKIFIFVPTWIAATWAPYSCEKVILLWSVVSGPLTRTYRVMATQRIRAGNKTKCSSKKSALDFQQTNGTKYAGIYVSPPMGWWSALLNYWIKSQSLKKLDEEENKRTLAVTVPRFSTPLQHEQMKRSRAEFEPETA